MIFPVRKIENNCCFQLNSTAIGKITPWISSLKKYKFSLLLFSSIIIRKLDFFKENKYHSLLRHQRNNCALQCFFASYFQPAILAQQQNHNKILPSKVLWPPPCSSSCTQIRTKIQIPTRRQTTRLCLSLGCLITWGSH